MWNDEKTHDHMTPVGGNPRLVEIPFSLANPTINPNDWMIRLQQ